MLGTERIWLIEPLEPQPDGRGGFEAQAREHFRWAKQVRHPTGRTQEVEGTLVLAQEATELELWIDRLTRRVTVAWGVRWEDRLWGIEAVLPQARRLAAWETLRLRLEHHDPGAHDPLGANQIGGANAGESLYPGG